MNNAIGIIPAAGRGTRAGGLPYPKELLPVKAQDGRVLTVIEGCIQQLANAEIGEAAIVIRPEKQVIADYLGNERFGVNLRYFEQTTMNSREGLPDAVWAGRMVGPSLYVMLMGDVYFTGAYTVADLVDAMDDYPQAVAGVASWVTYEPHRFGIIQHSGKRIISVKDKPQGLTVGEHWGAVAFHGELWRYIESETETFSNVLHRAAQDNIIISTAAEGQYLDYGTPEAIIDNIKVANT